MTARRKHSFRLPPGLYRQLAAIARARHVSRTANLETALGSYLSPDGADRLEAAVSRRLDRITRQLDRLAWHLDLSNETLALYIRFWLTTHAPLPDTAMKAAQALGKERCSRHVERLNKRVESGPRLTRTIRRYKAHLEKVRKNTSLNY